MKFSKTIATIAIAVTTGGSVIGYNILTDTPQEWYNIEKNEKSVDLFGKNGNSYNRRYNTGDSITYSRLFKEHYKYDNNGVIEPLDDCNTLLKMGSVKALYDEAKSLSGYDNTKDFTAIRIIYGMEGRKLIMIFQPIVLDEKTASGGGYYYDTIPSPNRYRGNIDGSLSLLTSDQYDTLVTAYQSEDSKIYIDKVNTNAHKYVPDSSVASCILVLQDIIEVYLHNMAPEQAIDTNDKIIFSFIASYMQLYRNLSFDYEQHIVIYYRLGIEHWNTDYFFRSYGADFSQLCPPHCGNTIWIKTYNN